MKMFDFGMTIFIVFVATVFCGALFYIVDQNPPGIEPANQRRLTHQEKWERQRNQKSVTWFPSLKKDILYTPSTLCPMDSEHCEHMIEQPSP